MAIHSIAGEWRGHYEYYGAADRGCGFNAFFRENSGRIEGTIVDDFQPGKAQLTGSFMFPSVLFTKVYVNPGEYIEIEEQSNQTFMYFSDSSNPVEYEGAMTEDGKTMSGKWSINSDLGLTEGTWTAYRILEEEKKQEEKVSIVKEEQIGENHF
jgi:hypothetical protein